MFNSTKNTYSLQGPTNCKKNTLIRNIGFKQIYNHIDYHTYKRK